MAVPPRFLLDSNVFIEAKRRYYAFDICPGFWEALLAHFESRRLCSIDRIRKELLDGKDELAAWVTEAVSAKIWEPTTDAATAAWFGQLMVWSQAQSQFLPQAKAEFATKADAWLVAKAKASGMILVTHEELDPNIRKKIPIPNACRAFGVVWEDTFKMLRGLKTRFVWEGNTGHVK